MCATKHDRVGTPTHDIGRVPPDQGFDVISLFDRRSEPGTCSRDDGDTTGMPVDDRSKEFPLERGLGGENADGPSLRGSDCGLDRWLHADERHCREPLPKLVECRSGCAVAGNNDDSRSGVDEELAEGECTRPHRGKSSLAVRGVRLIRDIHEIGRREKRPHLTQDSEPTDAGVEDSNGTCGHQDSPCRLR